ncbi:ATP synthase F1 subunit delta [Bombilactobacillus thymidiniphilus]|uniref:ATP synthase subunit delta n=1 Tax=Bombilactobacillus thymidiniphilus TaxID=2923363 RepID=A0ABY4PEB1_9LACO|nr:ATP synthase F1 subunit delta [Bombilactobacillus thymidiniphilus]UQS83844.1 F0F1 ATP synthase subunit delta [Bombilactobacillus thymidiniphilus]
MKLSNLEVGQRYARALFEVASKNKQQEDILQELVGISQVYQEIPNLGVVLTSNELALSDKQAILDLIKKNASSLMQNFLQMLFDYRRLEDFTAIMHAYTVLYDKKSGVGHVKVQTALALSNEQQQALKQALKKRFNLQQVSLQIQVVPEILGGLIIQFNNVIIDGSVQKKLQQISRVLLQD